MKRLRNYIRSLRFYSMDFIGFYIFYNTSKNSIVLLILFLLLEIMKNEKKEINESFRMIFLNIFGMRINIEFLFMIYTNYIAKE